jgi:hypothetical protein
MDRHPPSSLRSIPKIFMQLMQSYFLLDTQEGLCLTASFGIESTLFSI